jgi:3-methyladenine DNA glycosylase AlkD
MQAYMHHVAPFLGVPAPVRRAAVRPLGWPSDAESGTVATLLWAEPEREFAYVASDWLEAATKKGPAELLDVVADLIIDKSWWDTVDGLVHAVGNIVRRFPSLAPRVESWAAEENFWLARAAILHQLSWGDATDTERLSRVCLARAHDGEFFIRKAIGWALRDYAWRNPDWVEAFVEEHRDVLSALSIREATKNIAKIKASRAQRSTA